MEDLRALLDRTLEAATLTESQNCPETSAALLDLAFLILDEKIMAEMRENTTAGLFPRVVPAS